MKNKFFMSLGENHWVDRYVSLQSKELEGEVLNEEEKMFLAKGNIYARFWPDEFAEAVLSAGISSDIEVTNSIQSPFLNDGFRLVDDLPYLSVAAATSDEEIEPKWDEQRGALVYEDIYLRIMNTIKNGSTVFIILFEEVILNLFDILENKMLKPRLQVDYLFKIEQRGGNFLIVDKFDSVGNIPLEYLKQMKLLINEKEIVLQFIEEVTSG